MNEEDFLFRSDVTEQEKTIVLEHAMLSGRLVKTFPRCPMGADMIITQHHGMTNGQGFAVNYKDDISPLSKIIIISEDIATDVLSRVKSGDTKNISDNKSYLERLRERYKNHTYKKIIEAFEGVTL